MNLNIENVENIVKILNIENIENIEDNIYNSLNKNNKMDDNIWNLYDDFEELELEAAGAEEELEEDKIIQNKCVNCNSTNFIQDSKTNNVVCNACGLVNKDNLDRTFSTNNSNSDIVSKSSNYNCPTNYFFPKSSLGTTIGGRGNSRIKTLHRWTLMPYRERSRKDTFEYIKRTCKSAKPAYCKAVIDNARILYTNLSNVKHTSGDNTGKNIIIRGRNRTSLIAACVYFGCKMQNLPRSPKEIAKIFGLGLTEVTKGCRKFLEIMDKDVLVYNITSSKAYDYVSRCGKKLKIDQEYIDQTIQIVKNIIKVDYASDHQPPSIAAGSLLLVCNINELDINKETISKVFNISQVTITKIYNKIFKYAEVIINDEAIERVYLKIQKIKKGYHEDNDLEYSESSIFMNNTEEEPDDLISISSEEIDDIQEESDDLNNIIEPIEIKHKSKKRKKSKKSKKTKVI